MNKTGKKSKDNEKVKKSKYNKEVKKCKKKVLDIAKMYKNDKYVRKHKNDECGKNKRIFGTLKFLDDGLWIPSLAYSSSIRKQYPGFEKYLKKQFLTVDNDVLAYFDFEKNMDAIVKWDEGTFNENDYDKPEEIPFFLLLHKARIVKDMAFLRYLSLLGYDEEKTDDKLQKEKLADKSLAYFQWICSMAFYEICIHEFVNEINRMAGCKGKNYYCTPFLNYSTTVFDDFDASRDILFMIEYVNINADGDRNIVKSEYKKAHDRSINLKKKLKAFFKDGAKNENNFFIIKKWDRNLAPYYMKLINRVENRISLLDEIGKTQKEILEGQKDFLDALREYLNIMREQYKTLSWYNEIGNKDRKKDKKKDIKEDRIIRLKDIEEIQDKLIGNKKKNREIYEKIDHNIDYMFK